MLSLILLAALAADTRPVAVVATSKRPGADAYTQKVAERVHAQLKREEVPGLLSIDDATAQLKGAGITDPRTCQAARPCVGKLALILGEKGVVVSVDTARAGSLLAIVLEAVSGDGNRVLASADLTLSATKESDEAAVPIVTFARALKAKLEEEAPKPVAKVDDAPVKTNLEPALTPPPIVVVEKQPASPKKVIGGVLAGLAGASAVTAVLLGIVSGTATAEFQGSLSEEGTTSSLPQSRLQDLQGRANGSATGALVTGVAAAGLGVVAVVLLAGN